MPFSIAAARTNVLNVEPGCRRACESRLNWLLLRPGITAVIARMAPFAGSIEITAAAGSAGSVSVLADRLLRSLLPARHDRRVDAEAAGADRLGAVLADQLVADVAEEVRLADLLVEAPGLEAEVARAGRPRVLPRRDRALVAHRAQHGVAPRERLPGLDERVVGGRRLRQPGEQRRLAQREVAGRLREVGLRRRLDPVGEVAVVHLVEVRGEDALLRPGVVELDREARLLELPLHGALVRDVEVAHELLGDRRAALDDLARLDIRVDGARDALRVDAAVAVEAPVLDRDRGLRHPGADPRERDDLPVALGRDRAEERPVGGVDEGVLADPHLVQGGEVARRAEGVDAARRPRPPRRRRARPTTSRRTSSGRRRLRWRRRRRMGRPGSGPRCGRRRGALMLRW